MHVIISLSLIKPRVEEKHHVHVKCSFDRNLCTKKRQKDREEKEILATLVFLYVARSSIAFTIHRSINMGTNMDKPTQETEYLENKSQKSC